MDYDALCESARIARFVGNADHETDHKRKLAVALVLGRLEWIQAQGLSMKQAMLELGENAVRIVAAAKYTLRGEPIRTGYGASAALARIEATPQRSQSILPP